jgi:citronellol/citronellal dehydrogenase
VNVRGTFVTSRACVPHLRRSANPHILTLSPPLDLRPDWLAAHLPYTLSKYGMSLVMLGMAEEFRADGIACNTLWPRTTIATAAVEFALGGEPLMRRSRRPEIMADAAHAILTRPSRELSGHCLIDDEVLAQAGVTDFDAYRCDPTQSLAIDLFVDSRAPLPPGVSLDPVA